MCCVFLLPGPHGEGEIPVQFDFLLVRLDQHKYSEKSENIIGLDSYILNSFSYLGPISIYFSHCMTSSLKFEITVYISGFLCQFIQGH